MFCTDVLRAFTQCNLSLGPHLPALKAAHVGLVPPLTVAVGQDGQGPAQGTGRVTSDAAVTSSHGNDIIEAP